jgi:surface antigen
MFNAKALVAKSRTAVGKSLILLVVSFNVSASDINNPKFFEYRSGGFVNRLSDMSFGWFKSLNTVQKEAYHSALNHAIVFSENGQSVKWYESDASGYAVPVITWPTGNGYCRRVHIQAIAHNVEKTMTATACFNEINNKWQWQNE